jgi:mannose-1-phosphate guanylyltransferase/mannose-6-phosphate isomerase
MTREADALHAVILAGGAGERFWPASRERRPKPLLEVVAGSSLLAATVARARRFTARERIWVVCGREHAGAVKSAAGIPASRVLIEPMRRNTAMAIAWAAERIAAVDPAAVMAVLPADHHIPDQAAFATAIRRAARAARSTGALVTLGVEPTRPDTGYGYIQAGAPLGRAHPGLRRVRRFVEKPDAARAAQLLAAGNAYWNSGMFVFGAAVYLEELKKHRPDIESAARKAWAARAADRDFVRPGREAFLACPSDSIDYAVMERTARAALVPARFDWSDLGSWDTLWDVGAKDARGNVAAGDVQLLDAENCYVRAESRMVAVLGLSDAVVIETGDALLVASKEHAQRVKEVVAKLADANRSEHLSHDRVYRPWGYFESIDAGPGYQVKRLVVKPGEALSLQRHRRRAEHWVVVSGTARVTCDDKVLDLGANQSTFIPLGAKHRLENRGEAPLQLIEVQSGDYLGEDDIERFEDRYQRA